MKLSHFSTGLQHIGLPTNNMDATISFYESLGFTTKYQTINQKANERVAFLELNSLLIEAYENHQAALTSGAIDHIAINIKNIDSAYRLAQEQGLEIVSNGIEALPFWDNGVKFFIILGPNKERIEFNEML